MKYIFLFLFAFSAKAEFSPERPDAPDNAVTIPRGHFYIESEVLSHVKDSTSENSYFQGTARYGLSDKIELMMSTSNFYYRTLEDLEIGNASPRVRVNHYGLDGSMFQLSTIYGINFSMNSKSQTDWGSYIGVPFAFLLPKGWYIAATVAHVRSREDGDQIFAQSFSNSLAVFKSFTEDFDLFVQTFGYRKFNSQGVNDMYVGWGSAWRPINNFQLDFYLNYGVIKNSIPKQFAFGFSKKF